MRSEQILVADDEKRILEGIVEYLKREGLSVQGVDSGDKALSLFSHQPFSLVLLDISMPGLNGYEIMERLLELDPDVLIIIMTGYATVESAVRALKKGAWDYLKKPFEYSDLIKTVKNALLQRRLLRDRRAFSIRLEASERQYADMDNNSPDLIFTLDQSRCFTFVNDQLEKMLGYTRSQVLGKPIDLLVHKGDRPRLGTLATAGLKANLEFDLRFKRNPRMVNLPHAHLALKTSPIVLGGEASPGVHVVARDMTEQINLEAQLLQAQKMEAIGTLAGGIAHDFNNILMGIQGYASLVKSRFDRGSLEYKRLSNIDEYVASGADMARQLLGFAQKGCDETHLINLNPLLKMSAKMFGRTKKNIIIRSHFAKDLWGTVVDEGQIKQVLMNLFVNAWQAMPKGGQIMIDSSNIILDDARATGHGLKAAGPYVKIRVMDTGTGIGEDILPRIFDPFFTTKERGKGTGLGLATAYGILKSHGGAIQVKSRLDEGSCFSFFLPAKVRVVKGPHGGGRGDKIINGRGNILLVDDEKGVVEVCREILENLGYGVKTATGGKEALDIFQSDPAGIDLVILDVVMPGMDGYQTFKALRRIKPTQRVLISSGYSREDDIKRLMDKGCDDFILKPFDVGMLSRKIHSVFSQKVAP